MEKEAKNNTKMYMAIGAGVVLLLAWMLMSSSGNNELRELLTTEVKRGDLKITVNEFGELVALNQATVSAINDKQILYLAPEGSWVQEGDTVVIFESEKYKLYAEEAGSAVKVAQAEYQKALNELEAQRAKEEAAKKEYQSLAELAKKGFVVESESEQARLAWLEQQAKSKSFFNVVSAREADVDKAMSGQRNQLRKLRSTVMLAPREGVVVYATVGSGTQRRKMQVGMVPFEGQDLMYIPDVGSMLVKSEVNEVDLDKVRAGQDVEIRLDAFPDTVFTGLVHQIGTLARRKVNPATGKSTNTKVFDLVVKVIGKDRRLKPGLSSTIDIVVDQRKNVLYIPIESVFTTQNNRTYVYLRNDGDIERRLLKLGKSNDLNVEVKDGIKEKDIVLLGEPSE